VRGDDEGGDTGPRVSAMLVPGDVMQKILMAVGIAGALVLPVAAEASRNVIHKVLASPLVEEGSDPDGCTPAVSGLGGPSIWQVRVERLLLDGKGLVEASRQPEPNRFPLCIADLPVAKNAEVELSFVANNRGVAPTAGIVLRFVDPQDFYLIEADMVARRLRFVRVVNGERRELAKAAAVLVANKAQTLTVKALDDSFAISLDGKIVLETRDAVIIGPGRFGIASRADSQTVFGDLFITVLD
jgi:hypothetical protein